MKYYIFAGVNRMTYRYSAEFSTEEDAFEAAKKQAEIIYKSHEGELGFPTKTDIRYELMFFDNFKLDLNLVEEVDEYYKQEINNRVRYAVMTEKEMEGKNV